MTTAERTNHQRLANGIGTLIDRLAGAAAHCARFEVAVRSAEGLGQSALRARLAPARADVANARRVLIASVGETGGDA